MLATSVDSDQTALVAYVVLSRFFFFFVFFFFFFVCVFVFVLSAED